MIEGLIDECGSKSIYQRNDDKEDVIRNRISVYNDAIAPVVNFYEDKKVLIRIDASQSPETVFKDLLNAVSSTH